MTENKLAEAAINWLVLQRDPGFSDWEAFTDWLEADPAHGDAYQRLLALDVAIADDIANDPPIPRSVSELGAPMRRRWRLASLMVAGAALLAVVAVPGFLAQTQDEIVAASSAPKRLTLDDGSRIVLKEGARIRIERSSARRVRLERGEALFQVVQDPHRRFRVAFDGGHVENLGTRFTVARKDAQTEIAVAEGSVAYRGTAGFAVLRPGQRLTVKGSVKQIESVDPLSVGSWSTARLIYDAVPLRAVARDLSRELNIKVTVARAIIDMPITASIQLDPDPDRNMARLSALLAVHIRRQDGGWRIEPNG